MAIITIRIVETIVMDTETDTILSSTRTVENKEGVPATQVKTVKAPKQTKPQEFSDDKPHVKLDDGKLVLNQTAVNLLGAQSGDRVCISYTQLKNGSFVPVIGTQEKMGDSVNGNKLTKALTVSYKGKQSTVLAQYGSNFNLEMLEDGTAKLYDEEHKGLEDINDSELVSIPDDLPELDILDDGKFLDSLNQENQSEGFEKPDESITFDFNFN